MATMNIKDPEVHRLAHELAGLRGTSATAAVREALEHELDRARRPAVIDWAAVDSLRVRVAPMASEWLDDDDLYDVDGLPK